VRPTQAPAAVTSHTPTPAPPADPEALPSPDPGSIVLPGPLEPPAPSAGAPGQDDQWGTPKASPAPIAMIDGGGSGGTGSTGSSDAPRPAPAAGMDPGALAGNVINEAALQVAVVVKPAAAAAVATTFGFPLALMVAVLLFLFVQRYLDARDPKLRAAPRSMADGLIEFEDEERL